MAKVSIQASAPVSGGTKTMSGFCDVSLKAVESQVSDTTTSPESISADVPNGLYDHDKARHILNWAPRDNLEHFWQDR